MSNNYFSSRSYIISKRNYEDPDDIIEVSDEIHQQAVDESWRLKAKKLQARRWRAINGRLDRAKYRTS